jgi:hypothetical protein
MLMGKEAPVAWERHLRLGGAVSFRVGRAGETLVAEWPGTARLTCREGGLEAKLDHQPGADRRRLQKLRLGAVPALLRDLAGELGLHASAVALGGRGVLLVGPSGAGKSTAAAELCLRHGAVLLADDIASLEVRNDSVKILATERHHYLTPRSCRLLGAKSTSRGFAGKVAIPGRRAGVASYPVDLIAFLRFDDRRRGVTIRAVSGAQMARTLVRSVVRFDVSSPRHRELDQMLTLYRLCRVVELVRPYHAKPPVLIGPSLQQALEKGVSP